MNLFVTSNDPQLCAVFLDDRRVVNQIRETAQVLSAAARLRGATDENLYASTHENHPVVRWCAATEPNYVWTIAHWIHLHKEWKIRYKHPAGKTHASVARCYKPIIDAQDLFPRPKPHELTPTFVNCAANAKLGLDFTDVEDVHDAYRQYLNARWSIDSPRPAWRTGRVPSWIKLEEERADETS